MANQIESEQEPGVGKLVGGIVDDARELIVQQLALFQVEIKNDAHRVAMATIPVVIGASILMVAIIILAAASALLLSALFPTLPVWAGFAIVGGLIVPVGLGFVMWGKTKFEAMNPTPDQTLEGLKENIQWTTKK